MSETWRAVLDYEGLYEVSDQGSVRSLARVDAQGGQRRERFLKPSKMDAWGHVGVKVRKAGVVKSRYVHQLVLEAFVGPRPEGTVGCHWNDVPNDNRLENLRWASPSANRLDMIRNGHDHNLLKEQCHRGHPYDAENTRLHGNRRHCRECQRIAEAAYRARRQTDKENAA